MSVQLPNNIYLPNNYDVNSGVNSVPTTVTSSIQMCPQQAVPCSQEPSLTSQITGGVVLMAPIAGRHVIAHPLRSWNALERTNAMFNQLKSADAFAKLTKLEQGKAYMNLYKVNQMGYKVIQPGLRSVAETKQLGSALAQSRKAYMAALKAGDSAAVASEAAKMSKIYELGKKGMFGTPKAAGEVLAAANEAGAAAAKAALTAGAEGATGFTTASALAWGKNAWKTGGGTAMACIEGGIETFTEVIPAFSEGGFGEGVVQTGKSAVKVAGSVGGWCLGAKAGAAAGAAIGTAICPGIGTAIGSVLGGLICGIAGSWLGNKTAKAVTGKSWSEKKEAMAQTGPSQPQFQTQPQFATQNNPFQPSFGNNPFGQFNTQINPNLPTYYDVASILGGGYQFG